MSKKRFKIKTFATNVAISFFLASIFITCLYFLGEEKINHYTMLINKLAVDVTTEREAVYDAESKRLIKYPSYGKQYGTITISSIDVSLPLYYGDSLKILRYGIGQYAGSFFPGEGGSVILAGHNNPGILNKLDKVKENDEIVIKANYGTFNYKVVETKIVNETELESFLYENGKEMLILYTCYPINRSVIGRKTQRLVIYAELIGDNDEEI